MFSLARFCRALRIVLLLTSSSLESTPMGGNLSPTV